jgi:hypothetical protein
LFRFESHEEPIAIEGGILELRFHRFVALFLRHLRGIWGACGNNEGDDVMDDLAIAWSGFGHLNVFVFSEVCRNFEVLILIGT